MLVEETTVPRDCCLIKKQMFPKKRQKKRVTKRSPCVFFIIKPETNYNKKHFHTDFQRLFPHSFHPSVIPMQRASGSFLWPVKTLRQNTAGVLQNQSTPFLTRDTPLLWLTCRPDGTREHIEADLIVGCDGAFSAVRKQYLRRSRFNYSQTYIPHGYMELTMPPIDGDVSLKACSDL